MIHNALGTAETNGKKHGVFFVAPNLLPLPCVPVFIVDSIHPVIIVIVRIVFGDLYPAPRKHCLNKPIAIKPWISRPPVRKVGNAYQIIKNNHYIYAPFWSIPIKPPNLLLLLWLRQSVKVLLQLVSVPL